MSKYDRLWDWVRANGTESFTLTYAQIEAIAGVPLDHSFLRAKKELEREGFRVSKISMKEQKVFFHRLEEKES